jgi:hypothetical protein
MENTPAIHTALEFLKDNKYKPFKTAYFIRQNDSDMGDEDFCHECIKNELKRCKEDNIKKRLWINSKYDLIEAKGYYLTEYGNKVIVKETHTPAYLAKCRRSELKEYPAKVKFTYEAHDPDFGGGLTEPKTCLGCGEYFDVYFAISDDELGYVEEYNIFQPDDRLKFNLHRILEYYQYCEPDIKVRLDKLAEKIIRVNNFKVGCI